MILERFKERDNKRIGIIVFTLICIFLVSGVILYRTFAIFEVKINQNVINGNVQGMGDIEFAFYKDDTLVKEVPKKEEGYSLDTSSSYCIDLLNDKQISNINWDYEYWEVRVKNISTTKTKCYLHFKKIYQESILNGAIPDLGNGRLIPVQIKEEQPIGITVQNMNGTYGGKVVKADITSKWYSYKDKEWANAVILRDGVVDNYSPGQEILESDIESYFVWIPRYKYKLKTDENILNTYIGVTQIGTVNDVNEFYNGELVNGNKAQNNSFEIIFETKEKGKIQGSKEGDWITHPSFTSFDSNGFWVGKFETGYNQNTEVTNLDVSDWIKTNAEKNEQASNRVIIKPNVYSWRNIQIANAFYTSYDYYRELDSHMMKNTEWGAVAYLTQSEYGRCKDSSCTEIRINNNENYVTGSSAIKEPTCGYINGNGECNKYEAVMLNKDGTNTHSYYNSLSVQSSTTDNYSGIYDMAGGAWENVMGVMQGTESESTSPASGADPTNNSGFKGPYSDCQENGGTINCSGNISNTTGYDWPSRKYYDLYEYSTIIETFERGILGDATKEFGPFYIVSYNNGSDYRNIGTYNADLAYFVNSSRPFFERGDGYANGTDTGLFSFFGVPGGGKDTQGFRIVLTP